MMRILLVWYLNALALMVLAYTLPGVAVASIGYALIAALILGAVNTLVEGSVLITTLGTEYLDLFLFVINALLFWFAGSVFKGFRVNGFWWALLGAIVYSIISYFIIYNVYLRPMY